MLTEKSVKALAKAAGVSLEVLKTAISEEKEVDVEVKTYKSFNQDDWEKFEQNVADEKDSHGKTKYDEGKTAGSDMTIKELKKEAGLEFDGKTPKTFIKKFTEHLEAEGKITLDDKLKEKDKDIEALREAEAEKDSEIKALKGQIRQGKIDVEIRKHIPSQLPKGITPEDAMSIIKNNLEFTYDDDNKPVVKKAGEVLKDSTRSALPWDTAINDFVAEREWNVGKPGRGKGEERKTPAAGDYKGIRKQSELDAYYKEHGIHENSEEGMKIFNEISEAAGKAGEEFEYDVTYSDSN